MRWTSPDSAFSNLAVLCAPMNGKPLNTAWIAQQMGVSRPTALARVLALEKQGVLRLLPRHGGHGRPLLVFSYGYGTGPTSFREFCLDLVSRRLLDMDPGFQLSWWKTGRVRLIDLLARNGEHRIGFCFSASQLARRKDWQPLLIGRDRGLIDRGFMLHPGHRAFCLSRALFALPFGEFLRETEEWVFVRRTPREVLPVMRRINGTATRRHR